MSVTPQQILDTERDIQTIAQVANGASNTVVLSRLGRAINSLAKAVIEIAATNPRGAWATATFYKIKDIVIQNSVSYIVTLEHTSGVFANDLAAGKLAVYQGDFNLRADLSKPDGASKVAFLQTGDNAAASDLQTQARFFVRPEQFEGCDPTGVADSTAAVQAALTSLAATGGTVLCRGKYYIATSLNVPAGVNLVGDYRCTRGRPTATSAAAPDYSAMGSSLRLDPSATININGSCAISGLIIYRYGMVFPATSATTQAGFAGTAITVNGDDTTVENCLIMGFNKGYYLTGCDRPRINKNLWDNLSNIEVTNSADRAYISENHGWPFATICAGQSWQNLVRSGKNMWLHDFLDWAGLANNFCYGYNRGFVFQNIDSLVAVQCSADNVFDPNNGGTLNTNSINIEIIGNCYDVKLIGCQTAAGWQAGVNVALNAGYVAHIIGHSSWGGQGPGGGHGILITSGDAVITGSSVRTSNYGVSVAAAASKVAVFQSAFNDIVNRPIQASVVTSNVRLRDNNFGNFAGNPVHPNITSVTITSADPLPVDQFNDDYIINGNTNIGSISNGWKGRQVMLLFTGTPTVFNSTGTITSVRLKNGANFVATAGSVLFLYHNGVQWYEIGRT